MAHTPLLLLLLLPLALAALPPKISPTLRHSLLANPTANILVTLKTPPLPSLSLQALPTLPARASLLRSSLINHAQASQANLLQFLKDKSLRRVQSFWISNQVYVRGAGVELVEELASREDVEVVDKEPTWHLNNLLSQRRQHGDGIRPRRPGVLADWGIERMRVPEVWARGFNGTGLIIANIDTGVRGTHELLKDKWLGPSGGWFDPENKTDLPHDVYNHGTHTMGTLVGGDGIGVAPGARWTACKGYKDDGYAEFSTFLSCAQFMICPTDTSGANPDCSKTPAVVSNSWGWTPGESLFNPALSAWNAAGILASFSAGNTGMDGCSNIYSPADQSVAIAVGATDSTDNLALFSSRGPSGEDGALMKPEVSAPGVGIYSASALSDTAYMTASGTSMSCPNASGVLALLKQADPSLTFERVLRILEETADRGVVPQGGNCGGVGDGEIPNNHFGFGVVDALGALDSLMGE